MLDSETKRVLRARLRRAEGQVQAVARMIDADRACVDVVHQLAAAQAALGEAGEVLIRAHLERFVVDALGGVDAPDRVEALIAAFDRYRQVRSG